MLIRVCAAASASVITAGAPRRLRSTEAPRARYGLDGIAHTSLTSPGELTGESPREIQNVADEYPVDIGNLLLDAAAAGGLRGIHSTAQGMERPFADHHWVANFMRMTVERRPSDTAAPRGDARAEVGESRCHRVERRCRAAVRPLVHRPWPFRLPCQVSGAPFRHRGGSALKDRHSARNPVCQQRRGRTRDRRRREVSDDAFSRRSISARECSSTASGAPACALPPPLEAPVSAACSPRQPAHDSCPCE